MSDQDAALLFGGGFTIVWVIIALFFSVMCFLLPFAVWSIRSETKRQTKLLRGIIDELRALRGTPSNTPSLNHPPMRRAGGR